MGDKRPGDWQQTPTRGEWKSLAKVYAQRRAEGESAASLAILAEGLASSGSKAAAKKALHEVEEAVQ